METKKEPKRDVYSIVTDRIIAQLEKGTIPWKKPWSDGGIPQNIISKRPYRGINLLLLGSLDYERNYFITAKQLQDIGACVKYGQKSHFAVFWKWKEVKDEDTDEVRKIPFMRYYPIFNTEQCERIPPQFFPEPIRILNPIAKCEEIVSAMPNKPSIRHKDKRAYYKIVEDLVNMPKMNLFNSSEEYYMTLFHELIHATGSSKRLNRKEVMEMTEFGSEPYSIEELTAELGASMLGFHCGLDQTLENSSAYVAGWLAKLKNDKRFIVYGAAKAQQAVDYILNVTAKAEETYSNDRND